MLSFYIFVSKVLVAVSCRHFRKVALVREEFRVDGNRICVSIFWSPYGLNTSLELRSRGGRSVGAGMDDELHSRFCCEDPVSGRRVYLGCWIRI